MPALVQGRKVRVGFIGAGANARQHMDDLRRDPLAEVVAFCDSNPQVLAETAARLPALAGLPQFTDYRALIDQVRPDGVVISIPHTLHFAVAAYALEHGVSVGLEKPMTCSVEDARRLIELRDRTGLVLTVGYQRHYEGVWRYAHEQVAGGALGPLHFVEVWQCQHWSGVGWRGVRELSGGGFINDTGSHMVALLLWTTGIRPTEVSAYLENRDIQVDRLGAIAFRFPGPGLGTIALVGESMRGIDEGIQYWCRDGRLRIDGFDRKATATLHLPDYVVRRQTAEELTNYPVGKDGNFVRCIPGQYQPQVAAECGLEVAAFTEAVFRSVQTHGPAAVHY